MVNLAIPPTEEQKRAREERQKREHQRAEAAKKEFAERIPELRKGSKEDGKEEREGEDPPPAYTKK
jgi:hypothetical protein